MSEYDDAIRLEAGDDPSRRHGTFHEEWMIGNAVNGGLVMSTALQALGAHLAADPTETTEHVDPVVLSAYFMTASQPGPFTVTTEVMRCGRRLSTGQMTIHQTGDDGQPVERMRAIGSFGDLAGLEVQRQATPPAMPPPEQCVSAEQAPPDFLANAKFLERLDLRLDPATAGWAMGRPSMQGVMRGWLRLRDGREPDTTMLMMALDALPPVAFDLGLFGWTPTLEFTGHVRRRPAPGWLPGRLSERGRRLAVELGLRRPATGFAAVWSSDLARAVETADLAYAGSGVPLHVDARLRECDYGTLNGATVSELERVRRGHVDVPFPGGGQSYRDVVEATARLLADLRREHDGERVLLIAHSANRWALQHLLDGTPLEHLVTAPFAWQPGWEWTLA